MDASKHNIIENICKITISDTGLSKLAFMPMRVVNSANINPVLHCKALSKKFIFHRLTSIGRPNNVCVCVCVCVNSGLTSLSTIFQSYHDGVWLRGSSMLLL